MPKMKKVKVLITETFYKFVNVEVPADLEEADEIEEYVEEQASSDSDNELFDATSAFGIVEGDVGSDMDYVRRITLQEEE